MGSSPVAVTWTSDIAPALSREFLDIQATIEYGFTLKRVHDMIRTYSQLNMFYWKMSDFVSFPLFGFVLVIELRNFDSDSHWNTLIFFDKKDTASELNISRWKMSDLLSFPFLGFTLVIKLRNFDFESH